MRCFQNGGQIYYGECVERLDGILRHGHGRQIVTAVTVTGDRVTLENYEGRWQNDEMTGPGIYRWSDGSSYDGVLLNGRPQGHGKMLWPEGSFYDGLWIDGEMSGQGTFYDAFQREEVHGVFHRNFLKTGGTWVNVRQQRRLHRQAWLEGVGVAADLQPLARCSVENLGASVSAVLRSGRVPLILTDSDKADAPLCWLEQLQCGATADTTVHIAHAAAEKVRQRDYQKLFSAAIREAVISFRPFAVVFASSKGDGQLPSSWALSEFFDAHSFPVDLFDLDNFHAAGCVEHFLPPEKRSAMRPSLEPAVRQELVVSSLEPEVSESKAPDPKAQKGVKNKAPAPVNEVSEVVEPTLTACANTFLPPLVFLLRFVLVWLERLEEVSDDAVRAHVADRFSGHVPLHRVSLVVVSDP